MLNITEWPKPVTFSQIIHAAIDYEIKEGVAPTQLWATPEQIKMIYDVLISMKGMNPTKFPSLANLRVGPMTVTAIIKAESGTS